MSGEWAYVWLLLRVLLIEVLLIVAVLADTFWHGQAPPYLGG